MVVLVSLWVTDNGNKWIIAIVQWLSICISPGVVQVIYHSHSNVIHISKHSLGIEWQDFLHQNIIFLVYLTLFSSLKLATAGLKVHGEKELHVNKLKSLKVAQVKDVMDDDEDDGVCDVEW